MTRAPDRRTRRRLFPATMTTLSGDALGRFVAADYDVGVVRACRLFSPSLTHTYLVETDGPRYMLRVYRAGWRTPSDIGYELDVLQHLARQGVAVSTPVPRRDGALVRVLPAQEGPRPAVLFTYAPGRETFDAPGYPGRYGRAAAALHNAAADFRSRHRRFRLDLRHLLDAPLAAVLPFLAHRPADRERLVALAETLRRRVAALPADALETGFCHGDLHGGNAHLDGETLTLFDFDCCGPGWRAYELAVYRWDTSSGDPDRAAASWAEYLAGYTTVRPLRDVDLAAVPLFVAIRHFWWLGLQCGNARDWGIGYRNDRFFDQQLRVFDTWEAAYLTPEPPPTPLTLTAHVTLRPATAADTELARRVHHAAYRDVVERQFGPWEDAAQDAFFAADWGDATFEIILAGGTPCGYTCIEERDADLHVRELVIAPAFQGRGIGSALLRQVQRRARARGVPVHLGTFTQNRALALYERLGFREIARTAAHLTLRWTPD
jgi:Ser/Thr protein kinase RdoA (MazF antagonist)